MIAFMMLQVIMNSNIMHNIYIIILTFIMNKEREKKKNAGVLYWWSIKMSDKRDFHLKFHAAHTHA